jgi:hypothetical protein
MLSFFKLFHIFLSIYKCNDRFKNLGEKMILLKFGGLNMAKKEEKILEEEEEDEIEDEDSEESNDEISSDDDYF